MKTKLTLLAGILLFAVQANASCTKSEVIKLIDKGFSKTEINSICDIQRFTILDAIGVSLACVTGISIGYFLSSSFQAVLGRIDHFEHMLLLVFIVFIGLKLYNRAKKA